MNFPPQGLFSGNFIASRASSKADYAEVTEVCRERMNISFDDLDEIENTSEGLTKLINNDGEFKNYACYVACILQESGWMLGNVIDVDTMKVDLENWEIEDTEIKASYDETLETCIIPVAEADDECDVALSFYVCSLKIIHDL
ncbi:hypothetical protein WN48_01446 [Eufriesea mexicana]|nr:hypothetical protein WN48_01446 [Eufriesea mexicana]